MLDPEREAMLERLAAWGAADPHIRALVLTSSLAVPNGPADALSDYDLIVVVEDIAPFSADRAWLNDFGPVLVAYHDPLRQERGYQRFACITQYDRYKIDFTVQPVGLWRLQAADRPLEPDLDLGYRVLLDKDGLTAGMPAPTHRVYLPSRPARTSTARRWSCSSTRGPTRPRASGGRMPSRCTPSWSAP